MRGRSSPPSNCWTPARPCPSSPVTARKRPARSTTPSCAIWKSGCAICANWKTGALPFSTRSVSQDKLTPELETAVLGAESKAKLEDIYLPYKPKRRTKATIAREAGLGPLAAALLADPTQDPRARAEKFVDEEKGVKTPEEALEGARAILVEKFSEKAELDRRVARKFLDARAASFQKCATARRRRAPKFADYFDFFEPLPKLPSHRILALFRGEKEEFLDLALEPESAAEAEANGESGLRARHRDEFSASRAAAVPATNG